MTDTVILVDFRARAECDAWYSAIARAFALRWEDGATAEDALGLWCIFMDSRHHVPADAAPEVWDYLFALFLRTEGVRALAARHQPETVA